MWRSETHSTQVFRVRQARWDTESHRRESKAGNYVIKVRGARADPGGSFGAGDARQAMRLPARFRELSMSPARALARSRSESPPRESSFAPGLGRRAYEATVDHSNDVADEEFRLLRRAIGSDVDDQCAVDVGRLGIGGCRRRDLAARQAVRAIKSRVSATGLPSISTITSLARNPARSAADPVSTIITIVPVALGKRSSLASSSRIGPPWSCTPSWPRTTLRARCRENLPRYARCDHGP